MNFTFWANSKIQKFNWVDIQFIKIAVFAFTLILLNFWPGLLTINWYWYVLIFVLAMIKLILKVFGK